MTAMSKSKYPQTSLVAANPLHHEASEEFRQYTAKLGSVVYTWNELHTVLSMLFAEISGITDKSIPFSIWHSTESDRAQRKMLQAAVDAAIKTTDKRSTKIKEDINWLLGRIDSLSDRRNDIIHSPYEFIVSPGPERMTPAEFLGHPRAKKLKSKDLANEVRICCETSVVLTQFSLRLSASIGNPQLSWPERPSLPNLGQRKNRPNPARPPPPPK